LLEADYLIMGAGALGMAFADEMLTVSDASLIIVDRHHMPGGHWNDAYPFVRLHQPSAYYGAGSRVLGSNRVDVSGHNAGCYELASGHEVITYFDSLMRERFLPSGRVQYFPMSELREDGQIVSLISGETQPVRARKKTVDATYFKTAVPSTHKPKYAVADGVDLVTPNDLPRAASHHGAFTVIGGGKTGMDVVGWLLEHGADPDTIRWIVSRDSWVINREMTQPGNANDLRFMAGRAHQLEAIASAETQDQVFDALERTGQLFRLDPAVRPSMYHAATISQGELAALQTVRHVVRQGRVQRIEPDRIFLDRGDGTVQPGELFIDCTASALGNVDVVPVFTQDRITIQMVRAALFCISAAAIAFVEATHESLEDANRLCVPIATPDTDADWMRLILADMQVQRRWSADRNLSQWASQHRLTGANLRTPGSAEPDAELTAIRNRIRQFAEPAERNLQALLAASP
tara:strand:- start:2291 stop:3679 length:1389 start_codon:yes stop_codon:yes gene_type:complete